ncbi:MAG: FAD-dependent protein [Egibacteraceae bacterium]
MKLATGPADIGIRLETSAAALEPFIDEFYDFKVEHTSTAGITLRSFCVNGDGFVVNEYHRPLGIRGVNGHSFLDRKSGLSNLAILATIDQAFTPDPKAYVREVAAQVNNGAGGYPVRQTLTEFLPGTSAPPLDITPSNPKTRLGRLDQLLPAVLREAFTSYVRALGRVLPPVLAPDTVIYAPEIKYYNYRVPIDFGSWESTDIGGLFVVGNAAGYTASFSAAALSGIIAARTIAGRAHLFPTRRFS